MKVVVITHNYIRRQGDLTALYLHRLSAGLVARGMEIIVLCPHAPGLLSQDTIDGVRIVRFPYFGSRLRPIAYTGSMHEEVAGSFGAKLIFLSFIWSFYRAALKLCRREKPDLIWANWWIPPGLIAARVAKRFGIPLVMSSHGTDITLLNKGWLLRRLSNYVYRRTWRATVVSNFLKRKLLEAAKDMSADEAIVVPMPVGMDSFPKTAIPENDKPVILSVARYTQQKRLTDIIAAAAKVSSERIPFKLVFVGEGPLEGELKQLVGEKGLTAQTEFIPLLAQQKLAEMYRQCDVVVMASEEEGFGLVLVEAGLTGRPVVAARSGGITDIVVDKMNGLLFELGNIDQLADCLKTLLTDRNLRVRLGEKGYEVAKERFATPVLVDRMYNLFQSASSAPGIK